MNYIELINAFWKKDENWQFSANETRLYFYLLNIANRLGWEERWTKSDERIIVDTGISIKAMKTARKKLIEAELLHYTPGGNGQGCKSSYQILLPLKPHLGVKNRSPNSTPKGTPNGTPKGVPNGTPNPLYIRTREKHKHKLKHKQIDNSYELLPENEFPANTQKSKNINSPDLEEVKKYFADKLQLPEWEYEAEKFYYHYDGLGWTTTSGNKIKRWQSKANYWITVLKNKHDEQRNINNHSTNRLRSTAPAVSFAPGTRGNISTLESLADAILGQS